MHGVGTEAVRASKRSGPGTGKVGQTYLHSALDDHFRLAYTEALEEREGRDRAGLGGVRGRGGSSSAGRGGRSGRSGGGRQTGLMPVAGKAGHQLMRAPRPAGPASGTGRGGSYGCRFEPVGAAPPERRPSQRALSATARQQNIFPQLNDARQGSTRHPYGGPDRPRWPG